MKKCLMTISGNHYWEETNKIYSSYGKDYKKTLKWVDICSACGLLDDKCLVKKKK